MGFTEPAPPSSSTSSSQPRFDTDLLRAYIKKLLQSTLTGCAWPEEKERDRVLRAWIKEIGSRVEERMVEIQPRGYKTIVLTQVNENRNQSVGGRAGMISRLEETDVVVQEMFSNDSLTCICIAIAVRIP